MTNRLEKKEKKRKATQKTKERVTRSPLTKGWVNSGVSED
jgi:hypothetical protein